ncbi:hypothetical protein QYF36_022250 [Acer negundo]|nr:hypothetical protein QYF36_007082 [Acer negundo]KAK4836381.1 hypothetical protein QYF36_022250 [Acer negundo]
MHDHEPTPVEAGQKGISVSAGDFDNEPANGDGRDGSTRASIAERRAAKCGFKAEKISPVGSPVVEEEECLATFVMIPPGMSPTALLDSPIFLPNSQNYLLSSQLSPTTGNFSLARLSEHSMPTTLNSVDNENAGSIFRLKPHEVPDSLTDFSSLDNKVSSPSNLAHRADFDYQALFTLDLPLDFEFSTEFSEENTVNNCVVDSVNDVKVSNIMTVNDNSCGNMQMHCSDIKEPVPEEDSGTHNLFEGDLKETNPPLGMVRTSEDGYNWRKYGQKQVKGSEYPRSYYKCTHPNCPVKKKVERSYDGQITEIIYKGAHSHPKPQPSRRPLAGSGALPFDEVSEKSENGGSCLKVEGGPVWRNIEDSMKEIKLGCEWRTDGTERTSSTSGVTELSEPLSPPTTQGKSSVGAFESSETPELSSTLASHDENDDGVTQQGSISLGDEAYNEESQSKRRKTESSILESNLASRAAREPRVVVQIESEVDILDDGYRWRKYGQKVVKGNPNPRSYYKCTSAGCSVRKHVERASHNMKCVITTYEGKHNHEVPAARNNNHVNLSNGSLPPVSANSQPPYALSRNTHIPKPEPQIQDIAPRFGRKPESNNDYLRPSFLGSFNNDMKFTSPSLYLMKFPPLQNPYASFGLNANSSVVNPRSGSSIDTVLPDFPMSLPWSLPTSSNISLAGFDYNTNDGKSDGPVQSYLSGQQLKENNMRLLRPKQEQKDDNLYDACLPTVDHANASSSSSSSSSLYHQVMGNFPS